ncbi:hypothetical protein SCOR_28065 [Sulfidibacter corallicola]
MEQPAEISSQNLATAFNGYYFSFQHEKRI